jgi:hypothetical protein
VVAVDVQVAFGLDVEVDQPVAGDLIEHVIEEADAGGQLGRAGAVQVDANADLRFRGVALHLGDAVAGGKGCGHGGHTGVIGRPAGR